MDDHEHEHDQDAEPEATTTEAEPEPEDTEEDEDEDEDADDAEPEAQADPDAFPDSLTVAKKLDQLQRHVAKRVGEILGDNANGLVQCELCTWAGTPGWHPADAVPDAIVPDVLRAIGRGEETELKEDHYSQACGTCDGNGMVATGSKVYGQNALPCYTCKGLGWTPIGNERASSLGLTLNGPQAPIAPPADTDPMYSLNLPDLPPEVEALRAQGYAIIPPPR